MGNLKYIKSLDGVRGFAALSVMFFHFSHIYVLQGNPLKNLIQKISIFGQTGVTLFFVLSGFLITRILLNAKNESQFFSNFYLKRTIRIFPLYYLFLVIYYLVVPIITNSNVAHLYQQIYYWVYLQNFAITFNWDAIGPNHYWSLGVEEHFYLFWPLIVYYLPIKKIQNVIFLLIGVSILLRVILLRLGYPVFYFTFTNLDALSLGALLAIQEKKFGLLSFSAKKFGIVLLILIVPTVLLWVGTEGKGLDIIQTVKPFLLSLIYYCFIGMIIAKDEAKITSAIFKNGFILYTGKISYGLYVYHPLIYFIYAKYSRIDNYYLNFISCLALSYLLASLSYHFFESKFFVLRKYLNRATVR